MCERTRSICLLSARMDNVASALPGASPGSVAPSNRPRHTPTGENLHDAGESHAGRRGRRPLGRCPTPTLSAHLEESPHPKRKTTAPRRNVGQHRC